MIGTVLPSLRERQSGVISIVSSVMGRVPGVGFDGMYRASKQAMGAMSEALSMEVFDRGRNIRRQGGADRVGLVRTSVLDNATVRPDPSSPYAALGVAVQGCRGAAVPSSRRSHLQMIPESLPAQLSKPRRPTVLCRSSWARTPSGWSLRWIDRSSRVGLQSTEPNRSTECAPRHPPDWRTKHRGTGHRSVSAPCGCASGVDGEHPPRARLRRANPAKRSRKWEISGSSHWLSRWFHHQGMKIRSRGP
jgi:hypothetical protein